MNIDEVPFNRHIGIKKSSDPEYRLEIDASDHHENHLGTIHGAVIHALAETSTGDVLLEFIPDDAITAVICRSSSRYSAPARGVIRSKIDSSEEDIERALSTLQTKRKTLIDIETSIFTQDNSLAAKFSFTWLLSKSVSPQ